MIAARTRVDPIRGAPTVTYFVPGLTVAEMAQKVPLAHEAFRPLLEARIAGHLIDRSYWHCVRLKPAAHDLAVVSFDLPLGRRGGGGGGGAGKVLTAVAAIALVGAAALVSGGALAPLLGSAFASGTFGAAAAGATLSIGGALLLQGLNAPAAQNNDSGGSGPKLGFAGASNDFAPGSYLQRVIGTMKVSPKIVVPPFTTISGSDQFVTVVYGLAGHHQLTEIKVGEADIANAEDIEFETRPGTTADANLTLVTDTRIEEQLNINLSEWKVDADEADGDGSVPIEGTTAQAEPIWNRFATKRAPDKLSVGMLFSSGLVGTADASTLKTIGVFFRLRMRRAGVTSWTNLPDMLFAERQSGAPVRFSFGIEWVTVYPGAAGNAWGVRGWKDLNPHQSGSAAFATVSGSGYVQWRYTERHITLYLLTGSWPKDRYEFEIKRSWPFWDQNYNEEANTVQVPAISNFFAPVETNRVPRNPALITDDCVLTSVQSIYDEYPIVADGNPVALIAVRAKNRQIGPVTCIAKGMVVNEFGPGGVGDPDMPSSNPAANYLAVLKGVHNARPVAPAQIDMAELQDWHDWCVAEGHEVNAVVEGRTVEEVLQMIAMCGYATPRWSPLHGVVIDRPRDAPSGMITQRNAGRFGFSKPFAERPHALRVTFQDRTRDYEAHEITAYAEGYNVDGSGGLIAATRIESVVYEGFTETDRTRERAKHDMRWAKYRTRLITFEQDIENLEHRRGDWVRVETDILGQVGGRGRVASVEITGSAQGELYDDANVLDTHDILPLRAGMVSVSAITLDEDPNFGAAENDLLDMDDLYDEPNILTVGAAKGVDIRLRDGSIVTKTVASYSERRLVFSSPLAALVAKGDLVQTGPLASRARDMLIWEVMPGSDLTANIVAVDYAPAQMYPA